MVTKCSVIIFEKGRNRMSLIGKRGLGLILAVVLTATFPSSVFASDSNTTVEKTESEKENGENDFSTEDSDQIIGEEKDPDSGSGEQASDQISLSECTIILSENRFICDGKAKEPGVTVKYGDATLEQDKDYTVEYQNNVNIGTASAIVYGIGTYTDSKTEIFSIILGKTALTSTSSYASIKLRWNKVVGAAGYQIYRSTSKTSGYKTVKKIESGSTTSYSDTSTQFNTVYYYKIDTYYHYCKHFVLMILMFLIKRNHYS